jgi:enediyne biosynthesis protein E3
MPTFLGEIQKLILGISIQETSFARRGFRGKEGEQQSRLEKIGQVFLQGYHAALGSDISEELATRLQTIEPEFQGFGFEGAAMALALLDSLTPWQKSRFQRFLSGSGKDHTYMMHVGCGWVLARLRRRVERPLQRLDPLLGWLAVDGYGFHEGYFHWQKYIENQVLPAHFSGYALRAFDQGLGRSLWFVDGADVARIPKTIATFPLHRRADLWSGVGLACAYAGAVDRSAVEALRISAGTFQPCLAQGAAFAAKTRQRAGNPAVHTEIACQVLCGTSAQEAAKVTDVALDHLPFDSEIPAYEIWRQRIQAHLLQVQLHAQGVKQ